MSLMLFVMPASLECDVKLGGDLRVVVFFFGAGIIIFTGFDWLGEFFLVTNVFEVYSISAFTTQVF